MQVYCKKCKKELHDEVVFETKRPYRVINNHVCDSVKIKALEMGFIL